MQPGAPLFGVADGNPVDATAAYKGPVSKWGTANDPMVGHIIGGTITFGGGSPLVKGGHVVGGIGVSGTPPTATRPCPTRSRRRSASRPSGHRGRRARADRARLPTAHGNLTAPPIPTRRTALREGRIAQLVEQLTLNQRVVGSSPTAPTKDFNHLEFVIVK